MLRWRRSEEHTSELQSPDHIVCRLLLVKKTEELREINWQEKEAFVYADFWVDFRGQFHDIRGDSRFAKCLDPDSYATSQKLAGELLDKGSPGVVYPSVRHSGGTCIACFRPALVNNVRKGGQVSMEFENALATPVIRPI